MANRLMNDTCDSTSALHLLAGYPNQEAYSVVRTLLEVGKNPNCKNDEGITPVHVAASRGNYETLKLLLYNGGDPLSIDNDGKTPSDLASDEGHTECVKYLNWWISETKDSPKKPIWNESADVSTSFVIDSDAYHSAFSSPVVNSPIARVYTSPRFFASPLKDATNSPKLPLVDDTNRSKSRRKIEFNSDDDKNFRRQSDIISVITNDEDVASSKFIEFHESANGIRTPSLSKRSEMWKKFDFFELSSCCSGRSSTSPVEPSAALSFLNETLTSERLRNIDNSYETVLSEELSRILQILTPIDTKSGLDESATTPKNASEHSFKTILEQSLHHDQSEIENVDPKRLSFCKKLTDAALRLELTRLGYEVGPLTNNTRWLYVRRLALMTSDETKTGSQSVPKYSSELEKLFIGKLNLIDVETDEIELCKCFEDPQKNWREGRLKMSFCYLLLDPTTFSIDSNQTDENYLRTFVKSIFYVGKGKKSRPLQHLIEAARASNSNETNIGPKIKKILHLWNKGEGVISLHVFQNIIPVDAYTREASMIDAIGIHNLTNIKRGDYYGLTANWNVFKRRRFGAYLLKNAASILKLEGRRPLKLNDVVTFEKVENRHPLMLNDVTNESVEF